MKNDKKCININIRPQFKNEYFRIGYIPRIYPSSNL